MPSAPITPLSNIDLVLVLIDALGPHDRARLQHMLQLRYDKDDLREGRLDAEPHRLRR